MTAFLKHIDSSAAHAAQDTRKTNTVTEEYLVMTWDICIIHGTTLKDYIVTKWSLAIRSFFSDECRQNRGVQLLSR
eukprot:6173865-Pleurochrysis_carterae.AAC.1